MKQYYTGKAPDWFNRDKYKNIHDLFDFNYSLDIRLSCLPKHGHDYTFGRVKLCDYLALDKNHLVFCEKKITNYFKNSEMYLNDNYWSAKDITTNSNNKYYQNLDLICSSIKPTTPLDVQSYNQQINSFYLSLNDKDKELWNLYDEEREMIKSTPSSQEREDKKMDIRNKGFDLVEAGAIDYRSEVIFNNVVQDCYLIKINPSAPEKTLIEEFTKLVKSIKAKQDEIKLGYITQERLNKWLKYRVLEFVDLKIWFNYMGVKITDYEIGSIIFEDENIDVVSTIRKHTKKYANVVFSKKWKRFIFQQVYTNLKEYN